MRILYCQKCKKVPFIWYNCICSRENQYDYQPSHFVWEDFDTLVQTIDDPNELKKLRIRKKSHEN